MAVPLSLINKDNLPLWQSINMEKLRYIIYCRKSTDSEDRQVQSIEDQKREIQRVIDARKLKVVKTFEESRSAKKPGRLLFNQALEMISKGEADGLICWKLNRLSRNPVDGGEVQWLLQQGVMKSIVTPGREYLPTDNFLMMAVELGMANQFILDLSKDVTRGLNGKVDQGWRPGKAPLGYLNDKFSDKGKKQILSDPERFNLVRKMWVMLLTGKYTLTEIRRAANEDWGLRTREGDKLSLSTVYALFTRTFYYGEFFWNGEMQKGKHQPMVTTE